MKNLFGLLLLCAGLAHCHKLAVYWGQDSAGGLHFKVEEKLIDYCNNYRYDIIPVAFLDIFFDPFNKDHYPSINLANHCNKTFKGYPGLLHCSKVADQIKQCQQQGKQIIISLGGAAGLYSFSSSSQAIQFATTVWKLFLGGESILRPFDSAVLDGIDLDIEALGTTYYSDFIKSLRQLMATDVSKTYIITGAPQCPYPDVIMGPGTKGTVLHDVPEEFDYLFVQFYNNYCYLGDQTQFTKSINQWFSFAAQTNAIHGKGPLIYIGLPSHPRASSGSQYYQTPAQVQAVYDTVKMNESLGGIMLWDASFDLNNVIDGEHYSSHISSFLERATLPRLPICVGLPPPNNAHEQLRLSFVIVAGMIVFALVTMGVATMLHYRRGKSQEKLAEEKLPIIL